MNLRLAFPGFIAVAPVFAQKTAVLRGGGINLNQRKARSDSTVGIIGAGAAGLSAAYLLKKKGYTQVTILEAPHSVGGVMRTEKVDGKAYGMSAMFVPGGSLACSETGLDDDTNCIEPTLKELIHVSKELLEPADDFFSLNTTTKTLELIPEPLQDNTSIAQVRSQILTGLGLSLQLLQCVATGNFGLHAVCADSSMPILEWGVKYNVQAYTEVITYSFDGLAAGPSSFTATFANTLNSFASVEAAQVLRNLGKGYQTFWESLVQKAYLDVKLSTKVLGLERQEKWVVATNQGNYEFDHVIVATPPLAAVSFLPEGEAKDLLGAGIFEEPPNVAFITTGDDSNLPFTDEEQEYSFWPTGFGQGTTDLIDPAVGNSESKPFVFIKRHGKERNVFTVITYEISRFIGKPEKSDDEVYDEVKQYAKEVLDVELDDEYLYVERYSFPDGKGEWWGPYGTWVQSSLQGQDNLWFNGEAIAGTGVPAITFFSNFIVDQYF